MKKKLRVGIVFGGKSVEHEVSLQSAKNVIDALDKSKYEPVLIGIDKTGKWHLQNAADYLLNAENPKLIALNSIATELVAPIPTEHKSQLVSVNSSQNFGSIDLVFPVLHGTYGEDGTIQGLLKLFDVPFVGAGVLGSAVGMDKDVMKRLLRDAGLPISRFTVLHQHQAADFAEIEAAVGLPMFIKPANSGSSVGIHKVHNEAEFKPAIADAFRYDSKIIIEENVNGREIECSVLGNATPEVSLPGEVIPTHEFYSYDAKYIDENGAGLKIPADLPPETIEQIQMLAKKVFTTLCCEGLARVDLFLTAENQLFVNEINTLPGFTRISMYPKLWEASGLPYGKLIDRLIELAMERHEREKSIQLSYQQTD